MSQIFLSWLGIDSSFFGFYLIDRILKFFFKFLVLTKPFSNSLHYLINDLNLRTLFFKNHKRKNKIRFLSQSMLCKSKRGYSCVDSNGIFSSFLNLRESENLWESPLLLINIDFTYWSNHPWFISSSLLSFEKK